MLNQSNPTIIDTSTLAVIERFNEAFNRRDVEAVMSLMTNDCLFEGTYPSPDGDRFVGQAAIRGFWIELFGSNAESTFLTEEVLACGDRCVVRWVYQWVSKTGEAGHVRGIDLFRVVEGKVAEKLSYVKG